MKLYKTSFFEYFYKTLLLGLNTFVLIVYLDTQGLLQNTETNVSTYDVRIKIGTFVCICIVIWCSLYARYLHQVASIKVTHKTLSEKRIPEFMQSWGAVCLTTSRVYTRTGDLFRKKHVNLISEVPYANIIGWMPLPLNTETVSLTMQSCIKYKVNIENFELHIPNGALYENGDYYTFEVVPSDLYEIGTFLCTESYVPTCIKKISTQFLVYKLMDCVIYFAFPFLLGWLYLI